MNPRSVRRLVFSLLVAMSVAAPGGASAADVQLPDSLEISIGDDLDAQTRWFIEESIAEAWRFFGSYSDSPADVEAKLVVVTSHGEAAQRWAADRGIGIDRAKRLFRARSSNVAGLATSGYAVVVNRNSGGPGATTHEFVHLVQHQLAGRSQGPRWISEGAAEYFEALIEYRWGIDAGAEHPVEAFAATARQWAATVENCRAGLISGDGETCVWAAEPLAELEAAGPFDIGGGAVSAYSRAAVAFKLLIGRTGVEPYLCYLSAQSGGSDWETAFSDCFGMEVNEFYEYFDRSRANGFASVPYLPRWR